ncbi:MAG: hypothetical protein QM535_12390 [Limnohabitans sp.]|nr:hypothetical protein [Limnohabitans sp.]
MKTYTIVKPKNLHLENRVNCFKPDFNFNFEKAYLLIYLVILFSNKKSNTKKVELYSKTLEKLFCKDYHKYINYLVENFGGVGNVLNRYPYSENHCFSYILRDYFYENGFEIVTITDYKLINKFKVLFIKQRTNENIRLHYHFLLKHFKREKLTVHNPQNAIDSIPFSEREKYIKNAFEILKIMNHEFSLTLKTKTDGRVHTNISRLKKESRNFLRYENENLVEIDVKSAVPYFLYINMKLYQNQQLSYLNKFQYSNSPIIYMFDEITTTIDNAELEDFGRAILSGQLYEKFSNEFFNNSIYENTSLPFDKVIKYHQMIFFKTYGYSFDGCMKDLKRYAKKRILSMLFAPSYKYKFEQELFKTFYPSVLKFINEFKSLTKHSRLDGLKWEKKTAHKKLAHFCFQFEAKVMIDTIAREFDKKHKGKVPIYSLHDCLITTKSYANDLLGFMNTKFIELFGVAPGLSCKELKNEDDFKIAG